MAIASDPGAGNGSVTRPSTPEPAKETVIPAVGDRPSARVTPYRALTSAAGREAGACQSFQRGADRGYGRRVCLGSGLDLLTYRRRAGWLPNATSQPSESSAS